MSPIAPSSRNAVTSEIRPSSPAERAGADLTAVKTKPKMRFPFPPFLVFLETSRRPAGIHSWAARGQGQRGEVLRRAARRSPQAAGF